MDCIEVTIAAFILGLIGTLTGCLALLIQWLGYRQGAAKLQSDARREERAIEPFFKWLAGRSNYASALNRFDVEREFMNEGGAVTDLEIKAGGGIPAIIRPSDRLGEHAQGKIELRLPGQNCLTEAMFEISHTTCLANRSAQKFVWRGTDPPTRSQT